MDIRVLRYFLAVAREQNISKAADSLHITQPTLSRQIMELEEELGAPLLIRGKRNHRITLTEKGVFLRKRAEELIELADKTEAEFHSNSEDVTGTINIGAGESYNMRYIAQVAKELQNDYPSIHYCILSGNANTIIEQLDKGLFDFGIIFGSANLEKYNYIELPFKDIWGLLMRKDSPLAKKESISPADITHLPLICSKQSLVSNEFSGWYGSDFTKLNIIARYNLIYNASLMVSEGLGYALCFDHIAVSYTHLDVYKRQLRESAKHQLRC